MTMTVMEYVMSLKSLDVLKQATLISILMPPMMMVRV